VISASEKEVVETTEVLSDEMSGFGFELSTTIEMTTIMAMIAHIG
jgi:hypothetical protein